MTGTRDDRSLPELWLIRHGQTEWSATGQHTGRTDIPLNEEGRREAKQLRHRLAAWRFTRVITSPLQRAAETCRLAGYGDGAELWNDLVEWDYGDYEGITTEQVQSERPGWIIWNGGVPNGETAAHVGRRADAVIAALADTEGHVALFGHGHMLRILAARWLGLPPENGRLLALDAASVSWLGYEHGLPVVRQWNLTFPAQ
ncbi:MAG: histidine phosphatase family protein [Gammaproteobacteria bacterium]